MENKYKISETKVEFPFCVVIHSNNNQNNSRFKFNIKSVLDQDYSNYRIIYIDDGSSDQTFQSVEDYLKESKIPKDKYNIIRNQNR